MCLFNNGTPVNMRCAFMMKNGRICLNENIMTEYACEQSWNYNTIAGSKPNILFVRLGTEFRTLFQAALQHSPTEQQCIYITNCIIGEQDVTVATR